MKESWDLGWFEELKKSKVKESSIRTMVSSVNKYFSYVACNNMNFKNVTKKDFEGYKKYLAETHSFKTIETYIIIIRKFYRYLISKDIVKKEILKNMNLLYTPDVVDKRGFIRENELEKIITVLQSFLGFSKVKIEALVYFIYFSGPDYSEILKVKRSNFDLENGCVILSKPRRHVYFPKRICPTLKRYFNSEEETDNAFNITSDRLTDFSSSLAFYKPHYSLETVKTSFIMRAIEKRLDIRAISYVTGLTTRSLVFYYNYMKIQNSTLIKIVKRGLQ